ncbi:WXG100 family type VII secretion target [Rossellomorea aquimaris]|uniref:WXG100 family type VII secretion target n=1 Tax=Rossellomorea aquimaris TaxID=189382 RepID=UPI001CD21299|nr:WXG100 family type VII secretion target [Rossellomorea aquimaris]MCA1054927.1 WXG100 family type VII secretion target [Rossellomorea aquimaris]
MAKKSSNAVVDGTIDTAKIYATHAQIKEIVHSFNDVNLEVSKITQKINENWVGKGRNEFETQYKLLIKKIDDFGETLKEIYDALVTSEADYEAADDQIRQQFNMSSKG